MPAYYIKDNTFDYITKSKDNLICLGFIVCFKCTIRLIKCLRAAVYDTVKDTSIYIYMVYVLYNCIYNSVNCFSYMLIKCP